MFDHVGEIAYPASAASADDMLEAAIEAGAGDVESDAEGHVVISAPEDFNTVRDALEARFGPAESARLAWRPKNSAALDEETAASAVQAARNAGRQRRRAECLRQFRGRRRGDGAAQRLSDGIDVSLSSSARDPGRRWGDDLDPGFRGMTLGGKGRCGFSGSIPGCGTPAGGSSTLPATGCSHVADGVVHAPTDLPLAERLVALFRQLGDVLERFRPDEAAVEESFVNKNAASTLKLGVARGVVLLAPAERGVPVAEYSANLIKKSVVGAGHAEKEQVQMMVRRLLPGCAIAEPDAADALAVAICHAHHAGTVRAWQARSAAGGRTPPVGSPAR